MPVVYGEGIHVFRVLFRTLSRSGGLTRASVKEKDLRGKQQTQEIPQDKSKINIPTRGPTVRMLASALWHPCINPCGILADPCGHILCCSFAGGFCPHPLLWTQSVQLCIFLFTCSVFPIFVPYPFPKLLSHYFVERPSFPSCFSQTHFVPDSHLRSICLLFSICLQFGGSSPPGYCLLVP